MKKYKNVVIIFVINFIIIFNYINYIKSDATPGVPSPGEEVLLIYTDCTQYNVDLKDYFKSSLLNISPAPTITEVLISCGSGAGFYDELVAQTGQTDLTAWCQVYDLRFRDDHNNIGWTGQNYEDVITYTGANSDWELFENYLNAGGSLFLQGEHHDYYIRNTNLLMFVNHVAASPISQDPVNVYMGTLSIDNFPSTPENFNTDFNTLTGFLNTRYPGGVSIPNIGSGEPLASADFGANGGNSAMALAYLPSDLKTSTGRLVVSFETNAFAENTLQNTTAEQWIQNVYDFLSGCYRYDVTKTFNPDTLCVGQSGLFTICYSNTGAKTIPNVYVWDTIPTCLQFDSSTPSPTGNNGNLYWWYIGDVPSGTSQCITVNFTALQRPPCP